MGIYYANEIRKVRIALDGCDDTTEFDTDVSKVLWKELLRIMDESEQASEFGCQPTMDVRHPDHYAEYEWEDLPLVREGRSGLRSRRRDQPRRIRLALKDGEADE